MALHIPQRLEAVCQKKPERTAWLDRLPNTLRNVERRWSLTVDAPFDCAEVSCAWVAPVTLPNGTPAVLKLAMPHLEGQHESHALRF